MLLPLLLAACLMLGGCGAMHAAHTAAAGGARGDVAARARLGAFVTVAKRIYHEEVTGQATRAATRRIAGDPVLVRAIAAGRRAAIRREALRQLFLPGKHVVRLRAARGAGTWFDVGGAFVVGAQSHALPGGLGRIETSIQDVIGYVKLLHGQTGLDVVVRGTHGHVVSWPKALAHARLPDAGTSTLAGRRYHVSSFPELGFAGEPLRVWLLER